MKCFMDNGEAWSTNEVTINWNAPLAWVAAFLDEQGRKAK
jgi:endoglucanase